MNFRENVYEFFDKGFVVDTVQFKNPIVVSYYRYYFICEDSVIKSSDDVIKNYLNPIVYSYDFDDAYILHFREAFKINDRSSLPFVLDTSKIEKSEYVKFYKFKEKPNYFLLILCPMNKSMGLYGIRCFEGKSAKTYRELYKRRRDLKKAPKPKVINGAYMRHIICVWKEEKTVDNKRNNKDEKK